MEKEAEQLMIENLSKNMADADEYPAMVRRLELSKLLVNMLMCSR